MFETSATELCTDSQGDFSQLDEIEQLSGTHDAVINAATSDDLDLTKAINRGLAKGRRDGKKGVLVHISGTQLIESSKGSGCWEEVPKYDVSADMDSILIARTRIWRRSRVSRTRLCIDISTSSES